MLIEEKEMKDQRTRYRRFLAIGKNVANKKEILIKRLELSNMAGFFRYLGERGDDFNRDAGSDGDNQP